MVRCPQRQLECDLSEWALPKLTSHCSLANRAANSAASSGDRTRRAGLAHGRLARTATRRMSTPELKEQPTGDERYRPYRWFSHKSDSVNQLTCTAYVPPRLGPNSPSGIAFTCRFRSRVRGVPLRLVLAEHASSMGGSESCSGSSNPTHCSTGKASAAFQVAQSLTWPELIPVWNWQGVPFGVALDFPHWRGSSSNLLARSALGVETKVMCQTLEFI